MFLKTPIFSIFFRRVDHGYLKTGLEKTRMAHIDYHSEKEGKMKGRWITFVVLFVLLLGATACAEAEAPELDEPGAELNDYEDLVAALEALGAEVEELGEVPEDMEIFDAETQVLDVNGEEIQVFDFDSAEEAETMASLVAPEAGTVGDVDVEWADTTHFFRSGSLLVFYVGDDEAMTTLLEGLMGVEFATFEGGM
jgi:hypothetical protein